MTTYEEIKADVDSVMQKRIDRLKNRGAEVSSAIAQAATRREEIRTIMRSIEGGAPVDEQLQKQVDARQAEIARLDEIVHSFKPLLEEEKTPVLDKIKARHEEINTRIQEAINQRQTLKEEKAKAGFVDYQAINFDMQALDKEVQELRKERTRIMGYYAHVELG